MDPKVTAIMATYGRHELCERAVGMFFAQDYENKHLIIMQNSARECTLDKSIGHNKNITLVNQSGYQNLGEIYEDSLQYLPKDTNVVCFWDDDDIYMPNHISEGVKLRALARQLATGFKAVKPFYSIYQHGKRCKLVNNTLEPSWFIDIDAIMQYKFNYTTGSQHRAWVDPLEAEFRVFTMQEAVPTFCYTWGNGVYKTSGNIDAVDNFQTFRHESTDFGDDIITPHSLESLEKVYEPIYKFLARTRLST